MHNNSSTTSSTTRSAFSSSVLAPLRWLLDEIRWVMRVVISAADRFYWDNGFSNAASLAYTTLFALVPLTVLVFALLGSFALSKEHEPEVREFIIRQFVPQIEVVNEVVRYLTQFSETLASLNMLAVVFIVVTAILLINSIEFALNAIWQVYEARPITHRIAIYCTLLVLAPVLALSTFYFARYRLEGLLHDIGVIDSYVSVIYATLLPFLIDFFVFVSLYFLVPKAPVKLASAVFGAFVAAILFGFAKSGFAYYIVSFSSYDKVYGALASIPIFLFWLYLAWSIVLFGTEICYQAQYLPRKGRIWKRTILSVGDGRMVLAIQSLVAVASSFTRGETLPNDLELAERLGCSSVVLKPTLDALEKHGILQRGDSRSMPLVLLKSPKAILLRDVRMALFGEREVMHFAEALREMFHAFSCSKADTTTLEDLILKR